MAGQVSWSILDHSKEDAASTFRVPIPTLVAGNIAAQSTLISDLGSALTAIIEGTVQQTRVVADVVAGSSVRPTSKTAQREMKWLVMYQDNVTNKKYRTEIPTADLSLLDGTSDHIQDLTAGAIGTFVTAFQALVRPLGTNAVTVLDIVFVGKRL